MIDSKRTSTFLMANLGSEIARLFIALKAGNDLKIKTTKDRANKILNQLEEMPEMVSRQQEINIIKEIIIDLESKQFRLNVTAESLAKYFQPFALRVMYG